MKRPTNGIPITATIKSDDCWVCFKSFKTCNTEHHHVIPRCYGGEKGPTVSICTDCHTNVHSIADQLYKNANPIVPYNSHVSRERCLYLSTVIVNARMSMENLNSENKRVVYSGFFDGKTHKKLVRLASYFKMSQHKVLKYAIEQLYKRHFKEDE